jgi:predicted KAP-like P-loop ATPase
MRAPELESTSMTGPRMAGFAGNGTAEVVHHQVWRGSVVHNAGGNWGKGEIFVC